MNIFSFLLALINFNIISPQNSSAANWYAGSWDSKVYMPVYHPSTIALRIEVEDKDSRASLSNAEVRLEGKWEEKFTIINIALKH